MTDSLGQSASQSETVTVATDPAITSSAFGAGEVGVAYDAVPTTSGGTGPATWSISSGTLPAGLTLDTTTGEVSGTPTSDGTSTFDLVVTDSLGQSASQSETVTVATDPAITSSAFGAGEVGVAYDAVPTTSGGTGPDTWSVASGTLPAGLTLDTTTGEVSGTPTSDGTSTFDLVVTDSLGQSASQSETVTVATDPAITSSAFGAGEVGVAYDAVPTTSGGTGPDTWSVANGTLPAGLTLDTTTGEVSGTPTSDGTSTFDLVVTDSLGQSASQSETVTVATDPAISSSGLECR